MVWLFVVFVLTSSYTASLSSMLTVQRLDSNVMDIEWLKATRSVVGCNGASFVRQYLENVFNFEGAHIKNICNQNQYHGEFQSGNISAAVLGLPHAKILTSQFCKNYTAGQPLNRFGGLGFVSSSWNSSPFALSKIFYNFSYQMCEVAKTDSSMPFSPKENWPIPCLGVGIS